MTVDYAVTGGSATSPDDFTIAGTQLTFAAGDTAKNIVLTIVDDTLGEAAETIQVTLSNPTGAALGTNTVYTYTILASDNQAPTVDAGSDQTITLPASATLDGTASDDGLPNPPGALTYTWSKVSGPGTVTFADASAIDTTATFSTDGTYILQLQADDGVLQATDTLTVTVNPAITVQFATTSSSGDESTGTANLTVTLSAASGSQITVDYAVTGGTATEGSDYALVATGTTAIALKRDAGLVAGGALDSAFSNLTSNDVVQTTVKDAWMYGSGDSRYMNYGTVTQVEGYIIMGFDLSAYAGATVTKAQLRLRSSQGNSTMQIAPVKSHDWDEGNKSGAFPAQAPAASGVTWANPTATNTGLYGPLGWGSNSDAMFSATSDGEDLYTLVNFTSMPGGVAWCVAEMTSYVQDWVGGTKPNYGVYIITGNHKPYLCEAGSDNEPVLFLEVNLGEHKVAFAPGETSKTIPITIVDDATSESDETIEITLNNPTNAGLGTNTVHTYTIVDNDNQAPTVEAGDDQTITMPTDTVDLDGTVSDDGLPNPPGAVTVTWSKVSGAGTVTFGDANAVDTTATFSTDGTYVLQLHATDGDRSVDDTVTITIRPVPQVEFSLTSSDDYESVTPASLAVTLNYEGSTAVTVDYSVTAGTAAPGADFAVSGAANTVIVLKRDATLTQGGVIASQFTTLGDNDVVLADIKDARLPAGGDSRYMNYGTTPQAPSSFRQQLLRHRL